MFRVTFLGHQSWLLSSGDDHVLVDPLLRDDFGYGPPAHRFRVFPPRAFDEARAPRLRAVVLTHEHEDHFHLPSLAAVDRAVPVHLPAASSDAARAALAELGFRDVRASAPRRLIEAGALRITPLEQSMGEDHPGEWDSLGFLATDAARHGSFWSTVDLRPHGAAVEALRSLGVRPTLASFPDNDSDPSWMMPWAPSAGRTAGAFAAELARWFARDLPAAIQPDRVWLCANGYGFPEAVRWLDRAVWDRDPEEVPPLVPAGALRGRLDAPRPGWVAAMERGRLLSAGPEDGVWVRPRPRDEWDARANDPVAPAVINAVGPATGQTELTADERPRMERALRGFAEFLYGRGWFRSLIARPRPDGAAAFAFAARESSPASGERWTHWAYAPSACAFRRVGEGPLDPSCATAGARVWAADLLALLEGRLPAEHLTLGRAPLWNRAPADVDAPRVVLLLHQFAHPLRHPAAFLDTYRAALRDAPPPPFTLRSAVDSGDSGA